MAIYTSTQARDNLSRIIDETNETHHPIYIKGKRNNAVIMSEEDYEDLHWLIEAKKAASSGFLSKQESEDFLNDVLTF